MTKQEILDYFSLIDFAYNESGRLESLSRMLDELLKEQEGTISELQNAYGYLQKQFFKVQDEMLKEQKVVEPYQHDAVWLCGNCEKEVVGWDDPIDGKEYRYPFCRQCGRQMKWK